MTSLARRLSILVLLVAAVVPFTTGEAGKADPVWTQWGGPNQDFRVPSSGLAKSWPEDGPPRLWTRELGEGYSGILYEDGRLYTMYRHEGHEAVICLDAKTGETVWEHRYEAVPAEGHVSQFGDGPRATPLITGNLIFAIGVSGKMHALKKSGGEVLWSHDLWQEYGGNFLNHGYSSSPIEYKDTVIVLVGGENHSIMAFNKKDGSVAWHNQSFKNSYSTPRVMTILGREQLLAFMAEELISVDPRSGDLNWQFPHKNDWGQNINQPVVVDDRYLFLSSPEVGARGLKLTQQGSRMQVEETWSTRKIQFYHVTSILDGDYVYGSTGTMAPAFMAAVNVKTGEIAWRKRGFAKANLLYADGQILLLDEDGKLALTTATPEDLVIHTEAQVLEKVAWTVPTLVGKTLFVRDKKTVVALNLG